MRRPFTLAGSLFTLSAAFLLFLPLAKVSAVPPQEVSTRTTDPASVGCISCHGATDSPTMHQTATVKIGCADCHGGDPSISAPAGATKDQDAYRQAKLKAHVQPLDPKAQSELERRAYAKWLQESAEYIRFVNPGDLRVADKSCGNSGCHISEVQRTRSSMMTHGAMLWEAALYNNGAFPFKNPHFGESYAKNGEPQRLQTWPPPTPEETRKKGILPFLEPLPRWETSQPGNVLRVFERGGEKRGEVGNPVSEEAPGRPDVKLSDRGFGTLLRTDPVFLGLQKTRLLDPLLHMPGTNDQPGDYRGSGCSACHVVYANDRDASHSGPYAQFGNGGLSFSNDPTLAKDQPGHPIHHILTKSIPSSQCMSCHVHPGTNMMASYFGYTFWDNEVDGDKMYPQREHDPDESEKRKIADRNPEASAARGLWSDVEFLKKVGSPEFNKTLKSTQFGDFHSHGWIFRAVFKRDRKGNLLDEDGSIISPDDAEKFKKAVQLKDIHLEKGMHCVDCHFEQDSHGNGKLYGETRNAIEITCADCHGTIGEYGKLVTSGNAAPAGGTQLRRLRTPWQEQRFYWSEGKLFQRSNLEKGKQWEIVQVKDTVTPGNIHYSEKSRLAKTIQKDGVTWGAAPADEKSLAHPDSRMTCVSCHSSWTTTCFGCHLSMTANQRSPMLHNEGLLTRNWTAYNFQVLRNDVYMLGVDGTVTGNKVAPVRSACAVTVSSQNQNRDWLYYSQQTVSAEGFSGHSFSTYVPHTVRAKETKACTDCHVSEQKDNNAWMAQVLVQGTNFLNQLGRFSYVANGKGGMAAVAIAERDEPEAVIGSDLHRVAYPERYRKHLARKLELAEGYEHAGDILDVQLRGEYVYAAMGTGGLRIFDVANIDNKDFSERITTAPVSPLGQQLYVKTRFATAVATPSTLAIDPTRKRIAENEEGPIHPLYAFLYVADKYEGLVVVGDSRPSSPTPGVSTLLDGEPRNNFLRRALAFNPEGALNGARRITIAGVYAYMLCDAGLVVVSLEDPLHPKIVARIGAPELNAPSGIAVQFRYAFVTDRTGLKILDVTHLDKPRLVATPAVPLSDARNITISRTYAYVADGKDGVAIVDVERPEKPRLLSLFSSGELSDVNDVKIGMIASGQYALVADGRFGLKVLQLFSPESVPEFYGFSPTPKPKVIAQFRTKGPALAISRGVDRDRAVDESGNQLSVFGRRGARPFNLEEMQRLYLRNGELYTVTDAPPRPATP
jgi:Uncharacterized conserved protein